MANTINIPRPHLIMGLCLPLAVLIGYFLAEPMESGSLAVVILVLSVLLVPILMKWHHPLLVLSWNACIIPYFLPGKPFIWMLMAMLSLLFAVLNRSVSSHRRFLYVPSLTNPLVFLAGVVLLTAMVTGGIGMRALGSERYGGKGYFFILAAIAGYFALTSQRIPRHRVGIYVAMFFLSALTSLVGNAVYLAGSSFYFLYEFFPPEMAYEQAIGATSLTPSIARIGGLTMASTGLYGYLLARYGLQGVLDFSRPWRLGFFILAVGGCVYCGFRSVLILFGLTFICAFILEGLWRTRLMPLLGGVGLIGGLIVLANAQHLPLTAQRTLSFLPIRVDPFVRESADSSTKWRVEMWKRVIPQVPKYLLKGKGYSLDPNDLFFVNDASLRGFDSQTGGAMIAGDYHNGPLSVVIPFGIWGVLGFGWFLFSSVRFLHHNYRYGDPTLHSLNTFLLALFIAKILFFTVIFGSLYSDLFWFTGLIGLSVSINGEPFAARQPEMSEEVLKSFSPTV